jgi:hypothetical protein
MLMSEHNSNKPISPVAGHFATCVEHLTGLKNLALLCSFAIGSIADEDGAFRRLCDQTTDERTSNLFNTFIETAQFESRTEYSTLHGWLLPALWSTLEHLIQNVLVDLLVYFPDKNWNRERVAKLKISIGDFRLKSEVDRAVYVIDAIERDISASHKKGINRFEELLKVFELHGSVPEPLKDSLFELSEKRHLLVHRRGIIDEKFVQSLPRFANEVGQPLRIRMDEMVDRFVSVIDYISLVRNRVSMQTLGVAFSGE